MAGRTLIAVFKSTAWLLVFLAVLFLAGVGFLHVRPDVLREPVEHAVTRALPGGRFSMRSIRPSLWPSPGIRIEDCLLRAPNGNAMLVEGLECHLSWSSLLKGELAPSLVKLNQPAVRLATMPQASSSASDASPALQASLTSLLSGLKGVAVQVQGGRFAFYSQKAKPAGETPPLPCFELENVTGTVILPYQKHIGSLNVNIGSLRQRFSKPDDTLLPSEARDIAILADGVALDDAALYGVRVARADISLKGRVDGLLNDTRLRLTLGQPDEKAQHGTLAVEGTIHLPLVAKERGKDSPVLKQNALAPFRLHLPFAAREDGLRIFDGLVELERNSARINLDLGTGKGVRGRADVTRFSLPRWFAFARTFPGGLAVALDQLSGSVEFAVDERGLDVPQLRVHVAGTDFVGSASYRSSSSPALRIDLAAGRADINRILPELLGRDVPPPVFDGPPPSLGTGKSSPLTYAVNLRAESAQFWSLECGGLDVSIAPAPKAKGTTRLAFRLASFYDGSARQIVDLGKVCSLQTELSGVNLQKLTKPFSHSLPVHGTLSGKANFTGPAGSLAQLVGGLKGEANTEIRDGRVILDRSGKSIPFSLLKCSFAGRGLTPSDAALPPLLTWGGKWTVAAHLPASGLIPSPARATFSLEGPIAFASASGLPQVARTLPVHCSGTFLEEPVALSGVLSFSAPNGTLELKNLSGSLAGCTIRGGVAASALNTKKPLWNVQGNLSTSYLQALLERANLSIPGLKKNTLRKLSVSANATITPEETRILDLKANLDGTTLKGLVSSRGGDIPHWDGELAVGTLDLRPYLVAGNGARGDATARSNASATGSAAGAVPADATPIPVNWLKTLTLKGLLKVDSLRLSDVSLQGVNLPVRIENGMLVVDAASALCMGGKIGGSMTMAEHKDGGAQSTLRVQLAGIDMNRLAAALAPETLMSGTLNFQADLASHARYFNEFLISLEGKWRLALGKGFFASVKPTTRRRGTRYNIDNASASGTLANGLVSSQDLVLNGNGFYVHGKGTVNLKEDTINYTLKAATSSIPDIPIVYSGKLSDPARSIKMLSAVMRVLSSMGENVFSVLGDVLKLIR